MALVKGNLIRTEEKLTFSRSWAEKGNYELKVKAIDSHGFESDWATLTFTIPKE